MPLQVMDPGRVLDSNLNMEGGWSSCMSGGDVIGSGGMVLTGMDRNANVNSEGSGMNLEDDGTDEPTDDPNAEEVDSESTYEVWAFQMKLLLLKIISS